MAASTGTSYVQVLGAGTRDGGSALLLFFDSKRYLFTCGEGTQRFCSQHQVRLSKIGGVFLTRLEWTRVGGLPGMICTIADAGGAVGVTLVGPKGTGHFIGSLRPFLRRSKFDLKLREFSNNDNNGDIMEIYKDDLIRVKGVEIFQEKGVKRARSPPIMNNDLKVENLHQETTSQNEFVLKMFKDPSIVGNYGDYKDCKEDNENYSEKCSKENHYEEQRFEKRMPHFNKRNSSLCYAVEGPSIAGKFDAAKAKAMGIPTGPLFGKLGKGESITLKDGRVISPGEIIGPSTPGNVFIIIDIPEWWSVQDGRLPVAVEGFVSERVVLVFHYISEALWKNVNYQNDLLKTFLPKVKHVWCKSDNEEIVFPSSADTCLKLSDSVKGNFFTCPSDIVCIQEEVARPLVKYQWYSPVNLVNQTDFNSMREGVDAMLITQQQHNQQYSASITNPVITFLGTGAAIPGKYRNVSGTLVDYGDSAYLLDCGEATLGQIYRRFGKEMAEGILDRLKTIFISHLHADHQLGVPGMLEAMRKPVSIVAPLRYKVFLEEYFECAHQITRYAFVSSECIHEECNDPFELHGYKVQVVPVIHCPRSYGFVIEYNGIKISFSGDTRPCTGLAIAGYKSQILIHEATFCDSYHEEAIDKRHSTVSEAIAIGLQMECEFTLLTHFSQRYAKSLPPHSWDNTVNVLPVFDLMSVSLSHLYENNTVDVIGEMISALPIKDDNDEDDTVQYAEPIKVLKTGKEKIIK